MWFSVDSKNYKQIGGIQSGAGIKAEAFKEEFRTQHKERSKKEIRFVLADNRIEYWEKKK